MSSSTVLDVLEELNSGLEGNFYHLEALLDALQAVVSEENADSERIKALMSLNDEYPSFVKSLASLRDNQTSIIESYNTKMKLSPLASVAKSGLSVSGADGSADLLRLYVNELKMLDNACLEHGNLLGRLSSNLGNQMKQDIDTSISVEVSKRDALREIMAKYDSIDGNDDQPEILRQELLDYIDSMKMEKARYSLVNQYMLSDSYKQLTKEVTQWKHQYESLEGIMFGDNPNSIRSMVYKIESLKEKLHEPSLDSEGDLNMNS